MPLKYDCPPFILNSRSLARFREHAIAHPDEEVFGLLLYKPEDPLSLTLETYDNVADDKSDRVVPPAEAYRHAHGARRKGFNIVICHSHLPRHPRHFSPNDIATIHEWSAAGLMVYGNRFGRSVYYDSQAVAPLIGRPWRPVESNCYTLIRDALAREGFDLDRAFRYQARQEGISFDSIFDLNARCDEITVFRLAAKVMDRRGDRSTWFRGGGDGIHEGDILMFAPSQGWPAHFGVMGPVSLNSFLHHCENGISEWSQLNELWRRQLSGVYTMPASTIHHSPIRRFAS